MVSKTSHHREGVPEPGRLFAGKYRVIQTLGVGGMGAVVEAEHVDLGTRVAIKVMLPELAAHPEWSARFFREARACGAIATEHIARVHDVGRLDDGSPYIVMERLIGETLDQIVRARGPLPVEEAVGYLVQACEGLAQAHALGIVHRDVKPSNLFLTERADGSMLVKLLDFGVSKAAAFDPAGADAPTLTGTASNLGSPQYMSPEQLRNSRTVDARTDIWALGVTLHKLLTGRFAFEAETVSGYLVMIVTEPPTPLRRLRPDAPAELEGVLLRCLEKDRDRRYASVAELAEALQPFAGFAGSIVPRIRARIGTPAATDVASPPPTISAVTATVPWVSPSDERKSPSRGRLLLGAMALMAAAAGIGVWQLSTAASPVASSPSAATEEELTPSGTAPPAPTAAAETAPRSSQVSIGYRLTPSHARIELDGRPTSENPLVLPRSDRLHRLVVRAPGYTTHTREIAAAQDAELVIELERVKQVSPMAAPAPKRAATPSKPAAAKPLKGPMEDEL